MNVEKSNQRKIKAAFVLSALLLIFVVLVFTGILNMASFRQNYTKTLISNYTVAAGETVNKIEYAVKYGKPLDNFLNMEDLLREDKQFGEIDTVQVAMKDGRIVYNESGQVSGSALPPEVRRQADFDQDAGQSSYLSVPDHGKYYILLPIHDGDKNWVGSLNLIFDQSVIAEHTGKYLRQLLGMLALLAAGAFVALIVFVSSISVLDSSGRIRKSALVVSLLIVLSAAQIIFGIINYKTFHHAYIAIADENAQYTAKIIQKDVDSVVQKGVTYDRLYKIEDYLQRIVQSVPVIASISIGSGTGEPLYAYGSADAPADAADSGLDYSLPLVKDSAGTQEQIGIHLSQSYIQSRMRELLLDMATVLVTSFLFMVELTLFVIMALQRRLMRQADQAGREGAPTVAVIRPLAFLYCAGIFLSTSFIPVVMKQLYSPIAGLPKNVVLALPTSAEMLFAGISTVVAGTLVDRRGWKFALYVSLLVFALGSILSGTAWNAGSFIAARAVSGFGYGFALMAMRGFVNRNAAGEERSAGLSSLFSGMYAGVNCGVVVGGMLADRIGFSHVFFVAAGVVALSGLFAYLFVRVREDAAVSPSGSDRSAGLHSVRGFFGNRGVLLFFLLVLLPIAVCGMFLDYYFPLFAARSGISSSNVGRAFLLNGLCIVYLGPLLSAWSGKWLGVKKSVIASGVIVVAAMVIFGLTGSVFAAFAAVVLLGIAESFGLVAQNNYFLGLEASGAVGSGKALGYFDNVRKLGQMLGPLVFGAAATIGLFGIWAIGGILAVLLAAFLFASGKERKKTAAGRGLEG